MQIGVQRGKLIALSLGLTGLVGCGSAPKGPDLAAIYNDAAQNIGDERNPVVVIPGVLGSKLQEPNSKQPIWGAFIYGAADADTPEGARLVALPMREGAALWELRDEVVATEVLDTLTLDIGLIRGVEIGAYVEILKTLAAGKYADSTLGESGAIDYGGVHYTCFQFPYDWRRDVAEMAAVLDVHIKDAIAVGEGEMERDRPIKVDVVAHSMGGLVLRYYLRYGAQPLPIDGSLPELTWEGANYVEHAILVGTPSAGSPLALEQLVKGVNFASLITPTYRPAVLGTMPSIYQLLPRPRHNRVVNAETGEPIDVLDIENWKRYGWGLADPDEDEILEQLLPEIESAEQRRAVALDHLEKALRQAEQFFRALDVRASPPPGTRIMLIAGDAHPTADVISVDPETGETRIALMSPGDDTVPRTSALMDERVGGAYQVRLRTPVSWDHVAFLSSNHLGLTSDPLFADFVLYTLLEEPRE